MIDFTTTWHCLCGVHCEACRTKAEWLVKKYTVPDICPFPNRIEWKVPDEGRRICTECDKQSCGNTIICCGGKTLLVFRVPCPRGKWVMEKVTNGKDYHETC